jgi:hypothetical protein
MQPRYVNNKNQNKVNKGKIYPQQYVKSKPYLPTLRLDAPEKIVWHINWDDVTFRPTYSVGTPRLERM